MDYLRYGFSVLFQLSVFACIVAGGPGDPFDLLFRNRPFLRSAAGN